MANAELLTRTLEQIKANQEAWDQGTWATHLNPGEHVDEDGNIVTADGEDPDVHYVEDADDPACGTAMCFAGWATQLSGWLPKFNGNSRYTGTCVKDGEVASIMDKAAELLDIDTYDADALFSGGNSLDKLEDFVATLIEHGTIE